MCAFGYGYLVFCCFIIFNSMGDNCILPFVNAKDAPTDPMALSTLNLLSARTTYHITHCEKLTTGAVSY